MFDRERSETQTDIEFDFFDESPTVESPGGDGPEKRRRRMPTRPPGGGPPPNILRLAGLIVAAILLAVVMVFWISSCRADAKRDAYQDYMEAVSERATQSAQLGRRLNTALTTPGIKLAELRQDLEGIRDEQQQVLAATRELDPPGPLREQQQSLEEAMEFRVSGLDALAEAFGQVNATPDSATAGANLAIPAQRLVASDVVYADLFKAGADAVMEDEGVTDVPIPDSKFVRSGDLASPTAWTLIVDRLTQSPAKGGLHGNGIAGVRVQPGEQQLSPNEDNTVQASDRLAFQVLVQNSGDSQETQVRVKLTIQQNPVLSEEQVIDLINPGDTKTVTFRNFGQPSFGTRTIVKVNIEPVAREENTANNTAEYPVIFTLS